MFLQTNHGHSHCHPVFLSMVYSVVLVRTSKISLCFIPCLLPEQSALHSVIRTNE